MSQLEKSTTCHSWKGKDSQNIVVPDIDSARRKRNYFGNRFWGFKSLPLIADFIVFCLFGSISDIIETGIGKNHNIVKP